MWKWAIMVLALAGAIFATVLAVRATAVPPVPPPLGEPVRNPYAQGIAGAGIVEAADENVAIGVGEPGRVAKVFVSEGQKVKAGDPLFQTDTRAMEAQRITALAAVKSAEAELKRVEAFRRKEDEAGLRAKVAEATASLAEARSAVGEAQAAIAEQEHLIQDFEDRERRLRETIKSGATPEEQAVRARFAVETARKHLAGLREGAVTAESRAEAAAARLEGARADLNTYLAGPWAPDVDRSRAALEEARAQVQRMDLEIERRTVRAPRDATVIRRKLREGEYAMIANPKAEDAGIVLGDLSALHVRVDVDEFDARRYTPGAKATAFLKGAEKDPLPLEFVRVEPFIVPKRALTNSQRELVDTRVLQVIYRIIEPKARVYVGQQVTVFIEASGAP